ncbi:flippase-like domain-containing protein [Candidatus Roizmanbacteria bacterium]|nr:flippase-like domain-containing protein [Candidatus Roizmanbacteria bacterium]
MRKIVYKLVFLIILIFGLTYLVSDKERLLTLKNISAVNLSCLFFLCYLTMLLSGWQFRYLSMVFDIRLTFTEWFGLTVVNSMYNYFAPARGGMVARAIYLKKKYKFPFSEFAALTTGVYWFGFLICSALALILGIISYDPGNRTSMIIVASSATLLLVIVVLGVVVLYVDTPKLPLPSARFRTIYTTFYCGLCRFRENTTFLLLICLFCFGFVFLSAAALYWAFVSVGIRVSFLSVLLVQAFLSVSLVVSITPGNLGIREGIIGVFAGILGISIEQALLGAFVDRAISIIVVFFFGSIYSKILLRNMSEID